MAKRCQALTCTRAAAAAVGDARRCHVRPSNLRPLHRALPAFHAPLQHLQAPPQQEEKPLSVAFIPSRRSIASGLPYCPKHFRKQVRLARVGAGRALGEEEEDVTKHG